MTDTALRVSFPAPSGDLKVGAGLQEFRVLVRKAGSAIGNPTCRVELYETGGTSPLATPVSNTAVSSTTGTVLSGTWNANVLSQISGAEVEAAIVATGVTNGSVEPGAIKWVPTLSIARVPRDTVPINETVIVHVGLTPGASLTPSNTLVPHELQGATAGASGDDVFFMSPGTGVAVEGDDVVLTTGAPVGAEGDDVVVNA